MAAAFPDEPAGARCTSPSADKLPRPALGAPIGMTRCFSSMSAGSHGSATTEASNMRESLGSDISAFSRQSSGSYQSRPSDISPASHPLRSRQSTGSLDTAVKTGTTARRRGFMRPHGTDFAASARARESVLSLGSIAHLQYYFARTGLLDGKGGRLARKRDNKAYTLDLSSLDTSSFLSPTTLGSDHDSSYASMGSSPDMAAYGGFGAGSGTASLVESPIDETHPGDDDFYSDDYDDLDPHMLPPTTSTYNYREKPLPKPPTMAELRSELSSSLDAAAKSLGEAKDAKGPASDLPGPELERPTPPPKVPGTPKRERRAGSSSSKIGSPHSRIGTPGSSAAAGWHEIQGMHILDVMTLAIRAAKIYYTSHAQPDRLDAIKSEKELRGELLTVMEVLKRMATRGFVGGMRDDEFSIMEAWIASLRSMLAAEDAMEAAERASRAKWTWVQSAGWEGRQFEREEAFMRSMLEDNPDPVPNMPPLPSWTPIDRTRPLSEQTLPTPFLAALQNGQRLVQLHNCAVRKSHRRFGAIPAFHSDTQKPYRAADNLRYWIKAAELRWEVMLKADPLGIQYNSGPELWIDFEDAVLKWCRKVREEFASELQD